MDALAIQIEELARTSDQSDRIQLITLLRTLANSLEQPTETWQRVGYLHLQTAAIRIGFDLKLFKLISGSDKPLTRSEIALASGTDAVFVGRLLRYLAAIGAVLEIDGHSYSGTTMTTNLSVEAVEAAIISNFEIVTPQYQALPSFMKKNEYRNPADPLNVPFQQAHRTNVHLFEWFSQNPLILSYFNNFMALRRTAAISWLTVYPVEEEAKGWKASAPLYVNIGGGIGHQCAQFKQKFPELQGRVILQDLPHSIEQALDTTGVENMAHDFFKPQPVKDAKFYHARGVLHNHPDEKVGLILRNIRSAMGSDSILLLDEMVLPDLGVDEYNAALDLTMMSAYAGAERNRSQWESILKAENMRLVKVYSYNPLSCESVLDVRLS